MEGTRPKWTGRSGTFQGRWTRLRPGGRAHREPGPPPTLTVRPTDHQSPPSEDGSPRRASNHPGHCAPTFKVAKTRCKAPRGRERCRSSNISQNGQEVLDTESSSDEKEHHARDPSNMKTKGLYVRSPDFGWVTPSIGRTRRVEDLSPRVSTDKPSPDCQRA